MMAFMAITAFNGLQKVKGMEFISVTLRNYNTAEMAEQ